MKKWVAAIGAILVCTAAAPAEPQDACPVPGYLLYGDAPLERVSAAANKDKKLKIAVLGTASAMLPGPDGVTLVDDPPAAALAHAFAAVGVEG